MCQGHLEVFGISELLSPIHLGLCNYSQTIIWYSEKRLEVEMDGETEGSV